MDIPFTPTGPKLPSKQLSSSLKERLKRCGRYHAGSPISRKNSAQSKCPPDKKLLSQSLLPRSSTVLPLSAGQQANIESRDGEKKDEMMVKSLAIRSDFPMPSSSRVSDDNRFVDADKICNDDKIRINKDMPSLRKEIMDPSLGINNQPDASNESSEKKNVTEDHLIPSMPLLNPYWAEENVHGVNSQIEKLESDLKEKQETLRKLRMVKMYREKNDLDELQTLIDRWRSVTQSALTDLLSLQPEPRPSMTDLITHLQVDPSLVRYNADEQDFY